MAASSITRNFIITDPPMDCPYEFKYLQDPDEIRELMEKNGAHVRGKGKRQRSARMGQRRGLPESGGALKLCKPAA